MGELKKLLEGYDDSWKVFCFDDKGYFQTNVSLRKRNIAVIHGLERGVMESKYETAVFIVPEWTHMPIDDKKVS